MTSVATVVDPLRAAENKLRVAQRKLTRAEADLEALHERLHELEAENLALRGGAAPEHWMLPRCLVSRKVGYEDEDAARTALADCIAGRRAEGHRRMERDVYRCVPCGLWHLTKRANDPLAAADLPSLVAALQHRWR